MKRARITRSTALNIEEIQEQTKKAQFRHNRISKGLTKDNGEQTDYGREFFRIKQKACVLKFKKKPT